MAWLLSCSTPKHLHEDRATPSSRAKAQPDAVSRLIGKLFSNPYASDAHSASRSGTSSYAYSPASSRRSSSQYFRLGCKANAHNLHPGLQGVPLASVTTGMVTGVSLFPSSLPPPPGFKMLPTSACMTSTSSAPAAASTPTASTSRINLSISIPLAGHPGGRSDFLINAFHAGNLADVDDKLNKDLRKMAGDVSHKQMARSKRAYDEDEEGDDGDGSMFKDLDEPQPTSTKRSSKAKSPTKSGPVNWLPAEVDVMCQSDMLQIDLK